MKKTVKLCLASLIAITGTATTLSANDFGVELGVQKTTLDADFAYGSKNTRTKVSENELGLDRDNTTVIPSIFYKSGKNKLDFSFQSYDFNGYKRITKSIVYDNKTYIAGTNVSTTFKMDWYKLGYRYDLLEDDLYSLRVGTDVNLVKTKIELVSDISGTKKFDELLPLPTLAVEGDYKFNKNFGVEGKISAMSIGSKATFSDLYVGLTAKLPLIENTKWKLGYQKKTIDVDSGDFDGKLAYKGVYLGVNYKF